MGNPLEPPVGAQTRLRQVPEHLGSGKPTCRGNAMHHEKVRTAFTQGAGRHKFLRNQGNKKVKTGSEGMEILNTQKSRTQVLG